MATKYYQVKKDTFLWKAGAILQDQNGTGYVAIEDIWDTVPVGKEYISCKIIEHHDNSEIFVRVYPDSIAGKIYRTKDQLVEIYKGAFK